MNEKKDCDISENEFPKWVKRQNADDDRYVQNKIKSILDSPKINIADIDQYIGWRASDEERIGFIIRILEQQYTEKISYILDQKDINELTDFLNRLIHSLAEYQKAGYPQNGAVAPEELEEFRQLATDTDKIPIETLAETAPLLTTNSYLKMCRLVYDATSLWKYPDDISTEHIYCKERVLNGSSILHIDRDSPEEFARSFYPTYHYEELWFGGPALYIGDESVRSGKSCYTTPKIFGKWTGWIGSHYYDSVKLYRSVKMYIALRKNGYPIYCRNYEEIYNKIIKFDYLRK